MENKNFVNKDHVKLNNKTTLTGIDISYSGTASIGDMQANLLRISNGIEEVIMSMDLVQLLHCNRPRQTKTCDLALKCPYVCLLCKYFEGIDMPELYEDNFKEGENKK